MSKGPKLLSSLSVCLPVGIERHLPREEALAPRVGTAPHWKKPFGRICSTHRDPLLSKLLSHPEADQHLAHGRFDFRWCSQMVQCQHRVTFKDRLQPSKRILRIPGFT